MTKEIIKKVLSDIPEYITGIDRQQMIGEKVYDIPQEDKSVLRQTVERAMTKMKENEASDIDLGGWGCKGFIWFRIHGLKKPDESLGKFTPLETDVLCLNLLTQSQMDYIYENRNLDFSYQIEIDGELLRYRADMYFDLDHLALNCRYIPYMIRPFKDLNLHSNVVKALSLQTDKYGLTLVTGITGSGKSSTLDSIIDANNKTIDAHIVIIASPIETVHRSQRCIIRHREVGRDTRSFKFGSIQALRQDPDIICLLYTSPSPRD